MKIDMYGNVIHEPWNPSYGSGSGSSGDSLDLYECSYVDDGLPIPAIPAGITIKGDASVAGVYKADNASATGGNRKWTCSALSMTLRYDGSYWLIDRTSNTGNLWDSYTAYYYVSGSGSDNPWELEFKVSGWTSSSGSITLSYSDKDVAEVPGTGVKSWSGYKWLTKTDETSGEEIYYKEETAQYISEWDKIKPKVGKTYSSDLKVTVSSLYTGSKIPSGVPLTSLCAWYTLEDDLSDATYKNSDGVITGTVDMSKGYATGWSSSNYITLPEGIVGSSTDWTIGFIMQKTSRMGMGSDLAEVKGNNEGVAFTDMGSWYHLQYQGSEWSAMSLDGDAMKKWNLLAVSNSSSTSSAFLWFGDKSNRDISSKSLTVNNPWTVGVNLSGNYASPADSSTKIKHVFFYNKALSKSELSSMYAALKSGGHLD